MSGAGSAQADTLGELADLLRADDIEPRLAEVRAPALGVPRRAGVAERFAIAPTVDRAVG